jgi:hypothetical protein
LRSTTEPLRCRTASARRLVDVGVRRIWLLLEQRRRGHQLTGLAVAALRDVVLDPSRLQRMQSSVFARESFDRRDLLPGDCAQRHRARAGRHAIEVHRARAALGDAAAVFRADEPEVIAQHPQERCGFVHAFDDVLFVVDLDAHRRVPT